LWIQKHKRISINHKAVLRLTLAPGAIAGVNKLNIHSIAHKHKLHIHLTQLDIYHRFIAIAIAQASPNIAFPKLSQGNTVYGDCKAVFAHI